MTVDQKDYQLAYRRLMLVVAAAMLGWTIPYGIANYKFDECSQSLQSRIDVMKAKAEAAKRTTQQSPAR
jgi:hypothetical protein